MNDNTFYNEILIDHNLHPLHKETLENPTMILEGVNPTCGDDIVIQLVIQDGIIENAAFEGSGCAISQASADIMVDMIIGKTKEEALHLSDLFVRMIKGNCSDDELEELEEAVSLQDISHMPNRVKCAVLGWHTVEEMLNKE